MNLTENIPTKNIPKNTFELHCQWASEKNLCWNLHCTTCGSHEFRSGIYAIMTGENFKHGEQWNTHCKTYTGPWFKWDVTLREYITFCQVIKEASLFRISQTSNSPTGSATWVFAYPGWKNGNRKKNTSLKFGAVN